MQCSKMGLVVAYEDIVKYLHIAKCVMHKIFHAHIFELFNVCRFKLSSH